jgi:hypothetical protein
MANGFVSTNHQITIETDGQQAHQERKFSIYFYQVSSWKIY